MSLTAAAAKARTEALNTAFDAIGVTLAGTKMPASRRNTEPAAYEVLVAKHLKRIAEARETKAVKEAVKAGVMFDPKKSPRAEGTNELIYPGDVVEIALSVSTPATRLDADAFCADLENSGVQRAVINRLLKRHTHENQAPHKFVATLVTIG